MMRAGAGRSDITPAPGTHLSGDGMGIHRPARSVFDPLYARALVVESGERRICLLTLDLLCVTLEYTQRIREAAARQFGFKSDAILVHSAQNHSSPSLGNLMLDPDFPFQPGPCRGRGVGIQSPGDPDRRGDRHAVVLPGSRSAVGTDRDPMHRRSLRSGSRRGGVPG